VADARPRWCGNTLRQMDQVNQAVAEWKRRIALENAVREFLRWHRVRNGENEDIGVMVYASNLADVRAALAAMEEKS
jgi:hypothetical protein